MLTELDGVESGGDIQVRTTRKTLVKRVEGEAQRVEKWRRDVFQAKQAGGQGPDWVPAESSSSPTAPAQGGSGETSGTATLNRAKANPHNVTTTKLRPRLKGKNRRRRSMRSSTTRGIRVSREGLFILARFADSYDPYSQDTKMLSRRRSRLAAMNLVDLRRTISRSSSKAVSARQQPRRSRCVAPKTATKKRC